MWGEVQTVKIQVFTARSVVIGIGMGVLVSAALGFVGVSWGLAILDGLATGALALAVSTSWRDDRFAFTGAAANQRRPGVWMLAYVVMVGPMFFVDNAIGNELTSRADELALSLLFGLTVPTAYALGGIMATLERLDGDDAAVDPRLHRVTPSPGE